MSSSGSTEVRTDAAQRRRRTKRRWLVGAVGLALIMAGAVVTFRVVANGDMPRRLLVEKAGRLTGLDIQVSEFKLRWMGTSELVGVSVRLPLDSKPFLVTESIVVRHAPLHSIILSRDPGLQSLTLSGTTIDVREDARGRWTPQRVVALLQTSLGSGGAVGKQDGGAPALPAITAMDVTVKVTPMGEATLALPFTALGKPTSSGEYRVDLATGSSTVTADISTVTLEHAATVDLSGLDALVTAFVPDAPTPLAFRGSWAGDVDSGDLSGHLVIGEMRSGRDVAKGELTLAINEGGLLLHPDTLTVSTPRFERQPVTLSGGEVSLRDSAFAMSEVTLAIPGLNAEVTGSWNLSTSAGDLVAKWEGAETSLELTHRGEAKLQTSLPERGMRFVAGSIQSSGTAPAGSWETDATIRATGRDWQTLQAELSFPRLLLTDAAGTLDLSSARTTVGFADEVVSLKSLSVPFATDLHTSGWFDTKNMRWSANLEAAAITPPRFKMSMTEVRLLASGEANKDQSFDLSLETEGFEIGLEGTFDRDRPTPLMALMNFRRELPELLPEPVAVRGQPGEAGAPGPLMPVVFGRLEVSGDPLASRASGSGIVTVTNMPYGETVIPASEVVARAELWPDRMTIETDSFAALGGETSLWASMDIPSRHLAGHVRFACIDLKAAADAFNRELGLTGDGFGDFAFSMPDLDPKSMSAVGSWSVERVASQIGAIEAGQGTINVLYPDIEVGDIQLVRGETALSGTVRFDAQSPERIAIDASLRRYGFDDAASGVSALIDARAVAKVDLGTKEAFGTISLSSRSALGGEPLSDFEVTATLTGRTAQTSALRAAFMGGTVTGVAAMPVDDWTKLTMDLSLEGIDLARLHQFAPGVSLAGRLTGSLTVRPATQKHALAPMRLEADFTTTQGAFGPIDVGDFKMVAFLGPSRAVIEDGSLGFAKGNVAFWSRLSMHDGDPFVHLSLRAQGLDLTQLVAAASPSTAPVVGTIDGSAILGGYISLPHRAFGDADIRLTNAEVGNLPVVSQLYNLLQLDMRPKAAEGIGQARLRLEGDKLEISRLQYFHRGADIFGNGRIQNIWMGDQSEVQGSFAGAIRPLRDSLLPFGEGVDRVLGGLLDNAVSVKVSGILAHPDVRVVPFADVSSGLRRMLGTSPAR